MFQGLSRGLVRGCAIVSGTTLTFICLIAFVDSIGRFLNHPMPGAAEYVSFALLVFFFSSLALVVQGDAHIRVGLLTDTYKPKLKFAEKIFTALFEIAAFLGLMWMLIDQGRRYLRFGSLSSHFESPLAPWPFVGAGFVAIGVLLSFIALLRLTGGLASSTTAKEADKT